MLEKLTNYLLQAAAASDTPLPLAKAVAHGHALSDNPLSVVWAVAAPDLMLGNVIEALSDVPLECTEQKQHPHLDMLYTLCRMHVLVKMMQLLKKCDRESAAEAVEVMYEAYEGDACKVLEELLLQLRAEKACLLGRVKWIRSFAMGSFFNQCLLLDCVLSYEHTSAKAVLDDLGLGLDELKAWAAQAAGEFEGDEGLRLQCMLMALRHHCGDADAIGDFVDQAADTYGQSSGCQTPAQLLTLLISHGASDAAVWLTEAWPAMAWKSLKFAELAGALAPDPKTKVPTPGITWAPSAWAVLPPDPKPVVPAPGIAWDPEPTPKPVPGPELTWSPEEPKPEPGKSIYPTAKVLSNMANDLQTGKYDLEATCTALVYALDGLELAFTSMSLDGLVAAGYGEATGPLIAAGTTFAHRVRKAYAESSAAVSGLHGAAHIKLLSVALLFLSSHTKQTGAISVLWRKYLVAMGAKPMSEEEAPPHMPLWLLEHPTAVPEHCMHYMWRWHAIGMSLPTQMGLEDSVVLPIIKGNYYNKMAPLHPQFGWKPYQPSKMGALAMAQSKAWFAIVAANPSAAIKPPTVEDAYVKAGEALKHATGDGSKHPVGKATPKKLNKPKKSSKSSKPKPTSWKITTTTEKTEPAADDQTLAGAFMSQLQLNKNDGEVTK